MKKLLITLALLFAPSIAYAQCTGVFPAYSGCANSTNAATLPAWTTSVLQSGIANPLSTGASSITGLSSANTGFANEFEAVNSGTSSNAATIAELLAALGCTNCYAGLSVAGGTNPSATLSAGAGLTGGLNIISPIFTGTVTGPDSGTWGTGGINGSAVGGTTPEAGAFTTLSASSTITFGAVVQTFPASGAITGNTDTQTLTNKSIAGSEINSGTISGARMASANPGTTANGGVSASTAGVNVLRNSTLTAWFHGCVAGVCTAPTTAATANWCAEGVFVLPTGAAVTCQATATVPAGNPGYYALKIIGLTSNTDIKLRFVVESYSSAKIAGLATTFQFTFINNSGATITPTLTTKFPTTQDGGVTGGAAWGASTTDLSTTNLNACTNGSTCLEAYTLTASASATAGYEFVVDFGAMNSNADSITLGAGFDARATPGISTGINTTPPSPEVMMVTKDIAWCERFFEDSYDNQTAPGAATHLGMTGGPINTSTTGATANAGFVGFRIPMRAAPTMAFWDGAGTASKISYLAPNTTTFTDGATTDSVPFNASTKGFEFGAPSAAAGAGLIHYTADASLWGG